MEQFWDHSAGIADAASHVARAVGGIDHDLAYIYGLFRYCGMAVTMLRVPDYGEAVLGKDAKARARLTDTENEQFGTNHATLGNRLARHWLLPPASCDAILLHHSPDAQRGHRSDLQPTSMRLIAVAALAESACLRAASDVPCDEVALAATLAAMQLWLSAGARANIEDAVGCTATTA